MKPARRMGSTSSETRAALMDAADLVMIEEGYAAVTSRRVAERAGLKQQLVYYYFRTMDDLLLETFRRRTAASAKKLEKILTSDSPLNAVWKFNSDLENTKLSLEYMALANHSEAIRNEIVRHGDRTRRMQADALSRILKDSPLDMKICPPIALQMLIAATSVVLTMDNALGLKTGHPELRALVKWCLQRLEHDKSVATHTPVAVA